MGTKELVEKIEALPPEKKTEIEALVERLTEEAAPPPRSADHVDELVRRIDERRERLLREHGLLPDSVAVIRELREQGDA